MKGPLGSDESESADEVGYDAELAALAKRIIAAVHAKDADALSEHLESFNRLCSGPYEE